MYKYSKGLLPEVIGEMYRQNHDIYFHRTRSRHLLRVPQGTINDQCQCSFMERFGPQN